MSLRKSTSGGDSLSFSGSVERVPLRSLQNEILHHSTESHVKTKVLKQTKGNVALHEDNALIRLPTTNTQKSPYEDTTTCELRHVTSTSVTRSGGEVFSSSLCAEESIGLTHGPEDTACSDRMLVQSSDQRIEHPYLNMETEASCDVTWKSFVCDGGEVAISDDATQVDDSVLLPHPGLSDRPPEKTLNSSDLTDHSFNSNDEEDKAEHPYCRRERVDSSFTAAVFDVTMKFLNCTGDEVELESTEPTKHTDITIPLPADQSGPGSGSINGTLSSSFCTEDGEPLDHPYCATKMEHSLQTSSLEDVSEKTQLECKEAVSLIKSSEGMIAKRSIISAEICHQHQSQPLHTNLILHKDQTEENSTHNESTIENVGAGVSEDGVVTTGETSSTESDQQHESKDEIQYEVSSFQLMTQPLDSNPILQEDQIEENITPFKSTIENGDAGVNVVPPSSPDESLSQWHKAKKLLQFEVSAGQQLSLFTTLQPFQDQDKNEEGIVLPPVVTSPSSNTNKSFGEQCEVSQHSSEGSNTITVPSSAEVPSISPPFLTSDATDSALGLSPNAPALSSTEPPQAETLPDVFRALSGCPTVASALPFGFLSPVVRRASLALLRAHKELAAELFAPDDCAVGEKSLLAPVGNSELWKEHLDSPMPRPLFNSTALVRRSQQFASDGAQQCAAPHAEADEPVPDIPLISDGPLQRQLRQMAEFLLLASGKMGPTPVSSAPIVPAAKAEHNNACVGTTPLQRLDRSVNTSGQFERKRDFAVEDRCTMTDSLLWNVSLDSLVSVPRPELEQRLLSSMIMVEALVQQLAAARAQRQSPASPSDLREKLVQTEHTELSQTTMHRDLYLAALDRIKELEMDDCNLQSLAQNIHDVKTTMTSLSSDTNAALGQMTQIEDAVRADHRSLVHNYAQMKSLLGKSRESVRRMMEKVKDSLEQREDMRSNMEEAFSAKEAAFSVMDQLRKHGSMEISELKKCLGSQQELLCGLNKAQPEQVALNKAYSETLDSASELLSKTIEEQSSLKQELCSARGLLQKCTRILFKLNQKTDAAMKERDERIAERDQAVHEREQIEEELNQALRNLQTAKEQIGDLNLQVTILTSEMGVLRQKLSETEEARGQLDRKATELSATVASTLASYAFLEQALASETTKLQQSWKDMHQVKDRAQELELSLGVSEQRVCELTRALSHSEEQLGHIQSVSESQASQIQQLQDLCTHLSGVREMNEFLQMENELAREQMTESERMLRANLQSLRERNIHCEDLNTELGQLQRENKNLHEELESLRTTFRSSQVEHREKLAQAVTDITLLHHTLRGLTNQLQLSLKEENELQPAHNLEPHHHSSSFVDRVVMTLTNEKEEKPEAAPSDEPQCGTLFSGSSAFTRITAITPKKTSSDSDPEEEQSNVSELLSGLDATVTELSNALTLVQTHRDTRLEDSHNTICRLQRELESTNDSYQSEVSELKYQLSRLQARFEKGNAALQQKAQDDKTMSKLLAEISEVQEILNKHKADNNELRKEVVELRRSLHQSKTEAQILRDEMTRDGSQSSNPARVLDQKIDLMKEVERLKTSLQGEEQARIKLLERAKRHQIIYQTNQQKSEKELQMLNHMINKVRETLLCLPAAVRNCEQLQALVGYIG